MVDTGESVRSFFGLWFDIRRRKQCEHFLGHEVVKALEADTGLKEIALLEDADALFRRVMEGVVERDI